MITEYDKEGRCYILDVILNEEYLSLFLSVYRSYTRTIDGVQKVYTGAQEAKMTFFMAFYSMYILSASRARNFGEITWKFVLLIGVIISNGSWNNLGKIIKKYPFVNINNTTVETRRFRLLQLATFFMGKVV